MLTERKQTILKAIVAEYISSATPVASKGVVRKHGLGVSSATVRNEMVDLEEDGYITRPHSSSGRVPLDKGYRFYVESLGDSLNLPTYLMNMVRQEFDEAGKSPEAWLKIATSSLARMAQNMAMVTVPKAPSSKLRYIELVPIQESLILLVLVLQEAKLRQQLLDLRRMPASEDLMLVGGKLRAQMAGHTAHEIEDMRADFYEFEQDIVDGILDVMHNEDRADYSDHFVDGLSFLLSQPEFNESEKLKEIVSCLEDQTLVHAILEAAPRGHAIKIQIGSENSEDALRPLSVILCRYGVPEQAAGVMAVIGPTRMYYPHAIGGVRYISSVLDEMVEGVIGVG